MTKLATRRAAASLLLGPWLATACLGAAPPSPTPEPPVVIEGLASDTPEPPATSIPPPATPDFIATAIAGATAKAGGADPLAPTRPAVLAPGGSNVPTIGCEIPRRPELWRLAPAPDAPEDVRAAWANENQHSLQAEVLEHQAESKTYVLRPVDPEKPSTFLLSYDGLPLPLVVGQRYRLTYWQDRPADRPAGLGLKVEDEAGPVFLGVSLREAADAGLRVLAGDRAGFDIRQLPTQCLYAQTTPCGVELRAAPLEVGRGGGRLTLGPGKTSEIPGSPSYRVQVLTSHYHRPVAELPCPDPTDWVLSYRIDRLAAVEP